MTDAAAEKDILNLSEVFRVVLRRKRAMALASGAALVIGLLVALSITNAYESTANIRIEPGSSLMAAGLNLPLLGGGGGDAMETEIAIVKSRAIMGAVIEALDLQVLARPAHPPLMQRLPVLGSLLFGAGQAGPASITVDELTVPRAWYGEDMDLILTEDGRFRLELPNGDRVDGTVGQKIELPDLGFALNVTALSGDPGQDFLLRKDTLFDTMKWMDEALTVSQLRRTELIELAFRDYDPRRAEHILSTTLEIYSAFNDRYAVATAQRRVEHVEKELPAAMAAIDRAEEALNEFQKESRTINMQVQTEFLLKRLAENEELLRDNQLPKERERLERIREGILDDLSAVPDAQLQLQNLQRDVEIAQQIYLELMKVVQEQRILRASAHGTVQILDPALADDKPVGQGRTRLIAMIWVLGTLLAALLIVYRNYGGARTPASGERAAMQTDGTSAESAVQDGGDRA
ncbi:GNVR domain-containing protein [Paracoccus sp. p3-h83]